MSDDLNEIGAHCPTCGAEYRPGFDTCADDGTPLVPGPVPEKVPDPASAPNAPPLPVNWEAIAEFSELESAILLAGRLEAEGIEARFFPEDVYEYYGRGTHRLFGRAIQVLVPEHRVLEAQEIIRQIEAS